jgi:dihydropyrimidinase
MSTLIKNGSIVTPAETYQADLRIENEKIVEIGNELSFQFKKRKIIDAAGLFVFTGRRGRSRASRFYPWLVLFSSDDHYTGTKAAAFGGTNDCY